MRAAACQAVVKLCATTRKTGNRKIRTMQCAHTGGHGTWGLRIAAARTHACAHNVFVCGMVGTYTILMVSAVVVIIDR